MLPHSFPLLNLNYYSCFRGSLLEGKCFPGIIIIPCAHLLPPSSWKASCSGLCLVLQAKDGGELLHSLRCDCLLSYRPDFYDFSIKVPIYLNFYSFLRVTAIIVVFAVVNLKGNFYYYIIIITL